MRPQRRFRLSNINVLSVAMIAALGLVLISVQVQDPRITAEGPAVIAASAGR